MIHDPIRPSRAHRTFHSLDCTCRGCRPPGPADAPARADRVARACAAALAGIALVITADLLAGARGLRALLGLA